jgi:mono/diheme cytochrome c family protein
MLPRPGLLAVAWLAVTIRPAWSQERSASTLDGAYTAAQARRGSETYRRHCTECHVAAAVSGPAFRRAWTGRTLFDYFEVLRTTMPLDNPGRLKRREYADVVAYLLQLSGMPAGERALPSDGEGLKAIRIEAPSPADSSRSGR